MEIADTPGSLSVVNILFVAGVAALISSPAFAQTDAGLATPTGHELNASVGGYTYSEPGAQSISIHGVKVAGEYTATLSLSKRRHWFGQTDVRGTVGGVTYTGWCSPFLIRLPALRRMATSSTSVRRRRAARPAIGTGIWKPASSPAKT